MVQNNQDSPSPNSLHIVRRRKIFLRAWPVQLPPEWDDCDAGAAFDDSDELSDEWLDDDEY